MKTDFWFVSDGAAIRATAVNEMGATLGKKVEHLPELLNVVPVDPRGGRLEAEFSPKSTYKSQMTVLETMNQLSATVKQTEGSDAEG